MSDETYLSDDFDEKFTAITAQLRERLTGKQYGELLYYFRDKKLVGATRYIKEIAKEWDVVSLTYLAHRKEAVSPNILWHEIIQMINVNEQFRTILGNWNILMRRNGGPKHASKLARERAKKLPFAQAYGFAVLAPKTTVPVQRAR